jgi:hypothetical protein
MEFLGHHHDCTGFTLCSVCEAVFVCTCTKERHIFFERMKLTCSQECKMDKTLSHILQVLDVMKNRMNDVESDTKKMNYHIDFINQTYATLKTPLNILKHSISAIVPFSATLTIE